MRCPIDDTELKMSYREGIEIDYCPKCRGVWLDRGELDKIIEKTETESSRSYDDYDARPGKQRRRDDRSQDEDEEEGGFISNIFGGFGRGDD